MVDASAIASSLTEGRVSSEARKARTDPPYEPTPEDTEIIKLVTERISWTSDNPTRDQLFRQLYEQISFVAGIQWIEYSHATRRFAKWSAPAWFPTPVTNEMAPRVTAMQARLLSVNPVGRARPNSGDADDREAANLADSAIDHAHLVTNEAMVRQFGVLYATVMGTVIFKDTFDPNAGRRMEIPRTQIVEKPAMQPISRCNNAECATPGGPEEQGDPCFICGSGTMAPAETPRMFGDGSPATIVSSEPVLDENGQPVVDVIYEGELRSEARMIFNFFWDPSATTLDEARWCGEAIYTPLEQIDQAFPEVGPYVAEETCADTQSSYLTSLISLVGTSTQGGNVQSGVSPMKGGAVIRWYEAKPSQKFPRGLLAIVANGILLHRGDHPIVDETGQPTGDFSFTLFQFDLVPGRLAGRTPIEDMVPLQRRLNGIDSQVILNRKSLINPWIMAPKGSGLKPGQTLMRPGTTVVYNFIGVGAAPTVVQGTPLPDQVYKEREQCLESMDRLAQDPRISLAEMPQGVKSGTALNFIKEQGDASSSPRLQRWGEAMAARDRKRLLLIQANYTEDRTIRLFGQGSEWQVRYFKGADLKGNTDVVVDPGSLLPRSRSAQEQAMFDLIDVGAIDLQDPMQRQRLFQEMGFSKFETEIGPDYRRASKENLEMDQGVPVEPTPVDNDEVHLSLHYARQKDPSFDYLPPEAQMEHQMHAQKHMDRLLHRLAMQDAAQMASGAPQGGPDASGGPPPPDGGGPPPGGAPDAGGQPGVATPPPGQDNPSKTPMAA